MNGINKWMSRVDLRLALIARADALAGERAVAANCYSVSVANG